MTIEQQTRAVLQIPMSEQEMVDWANYCDEHEINQWYREVKRLMFEAAAA